MAAAASTLLALAGLSAPATQATAADAEGLERKVEELERRDAEREARVAELERKLAAAEAAEAAPDEPQEPKPVLWSRPIGANASIGLIDVSADVSVVAGGSTVSNELLRDLQGGSHDPRRTGFNLTAVELGISGAVDPYLRGDVYLVYFLDENGESRFELEEAFATTQSLPWGLQLEAGTFFTEFGRANPQHQHQWKWLDQPFVVTRFLGEDGVRGPGFRIGWLMPLPWFAELHFGMQNSDGETQVSFLANDEVFAERPIGGRPYTDRTLDGGDDFTYLLRLVNGFDIGSSWSTQIGVSALLGPNQTGENARTGIYGIDLVAKWRPEKSDRGWPFFRFQTEFMLRDYEAAAFPGDASSFPFSPIPALPQEDLVDWGMYAEGFWGFRRMFAAGLRYEYGTGSGASYDPGDPFGSSPRFTPISSDADPYRSTRHRVSPLLLFQPTEYARVRLQYNYDRDTQLPDGSAHTAWIGLEFGLGAHPAHTY